MQYEITGTEEQAKEWAKRCELMAISIGESMDIKVPIEAEGKVGRNWSQCH